MASKLTAASLFLVNPNLAISLRSLAGIDPMLPSYQQIMAQINSEEEYVPLYKTEDPHGICLIILGCFLAIMAITVLWKNEQRAVAFYQML